MGQKREPLMEIDLPFPQIGKNKIRRMFDVSEIQKDKILMVTTDKVSAFDVVQKDGIPSKGEVLTRISAFWFKKTALVCPNHFITNEFESLPQELQERLSLYRGSLEGRMMLVQKAKPIMVECIVRGSLLGSAWESYRKTGEVCEIKLPHGLKKGDKLPALIFTPSTKAGSGEHDENISFSQMVSLVGIKTARLLRAYSLSIYSHMANLSARRGIEIPDTKFEFGYSNGQIIQIDESGTPDSSRYVPDLSKQLLRDYLESINKRTTPIFLPKPLIEKIRQNYVKSCQIITGYKIPQ